EGIARQHALIVGQVQTTVNPKHTRISGHCQAAAHQTGPAAYDQPTTDVIGGSNRYTPGRTRHTVCRRAQTRAGSHVQGWSIVFGLSKSKPVAGLDIGSSAVKAVELKASGGHYRVTACASEPVPPHSIVDGAIMDGGAVADA